MFLFLNSLYVPYYLSQMSLEVLSISHAPSLLFPLWQ